MQRAGPPFGHTHHHTCMAGTKAQCQPCRQLPQLPGPTRIYDTSRNAQLRSGPRFSHAPKGVPPCRAASSGKKWRYGTTLIAAAAINRQARAATGKAPLLALVVCHQKLPDPACRKYSLDPPYKTKSKSSTEQASIRCLLPQKQLW